VTEEAVYRKPERPPMKRSGWRSLGVVLALLSCGYLGGVLRTSRSEPASHVSGVRTIEGLLVVPNYVGSNTTGDPCFSDSVPITKPILLKGASGALKGAAQLGLGMVVSPEGELPMCSYKFTFHEVEVEPAYRIEYDGRMIVYTRSELGLADWKVVIRPAG